MRYIFILALVLSCLIFIGCENEAPKKINYTTIVMTDADNSKCGIDFSSDQSIPSDGSGESGNVDDVENANSDDYSDDVEIMAEISESDSMNDEILDSTDFTPEDSNADSQIAIDFINPDDSLEDLSTKTNPNADINLNIAVVEFVNVNDPKKDFYYEYYCNYDDCVFRTPDQDSYSFYQRCGKTCLVFNKTYFELFNNPKGITNIYPLRKAEPKYSYPSIYAMKTFYENEAKEYGKDLNVNIEIIGIYPVYDLPPRIGRYNSTEELESYFNIKKDEYGIDISRYDIVSYVYFSDDPLFVSRGFDTDKKSISNILISVSDLFYAVEIITHENVHALGAGDLYASASGLGGCIYPQGYPEPNKIPLYPQTSECLMCGHLMISENEVSGVSTFEKTHICDATAQAIGWI